MYNKSSKISASEINKFTYCPYQWYYERKFGKGNIMEIYKKNKKYKKSGESSHISNFEKGNRFHAQFHKNYKTAAVVKLLLAVLVAIVFFVVIRWMM